MTKTFLSLLLSFLVAFPQSFPVTGTNPAFVISEKPNSLKPETEKLTHFKLYWHDIVSGSSPTVLRIVNPPADKTLPTGFGAINMIDDPLTETPDMGSNLIGRAQGFYGVASQKELELLMAMNFVFTAGKYNGSTLTILGNNAVFHKVREMSVVGGSGVFRFARGYAEASTNTFDQKSGDAVVEYNVHVLHY